MKYITLILILCQSINFQSPNKISGKITYEVDLNKKLLNNKVIDKNPKLKFIIENADPVSYNLSFDNNVSRYEIVESIQNDSKSKLNIVKTGSGGSNVFYFDNKNQKTEKQMSFGGDNFIIEIDKKKWKILNQSKKIGKYSCIKAILLDSKNELTPISAWFTTDIPLSYGPKDYNGLPGVILELNAGKFIYKATQVFISDNYIQIEKNLEGKRMSEKEFIEKFKNFFDKN